MNENPYFIIDFDSTFVTVECLDELANITLDGNINRTKILSEIRKITQMGMEGKISISESLRQRLLLFQTNKKHIANLILQIKNHVTPSIRKNKEFLKLYADRIYIVSGGFKEFILPVVTEYGINKEHVFANTFNFDKEGRIVGFDEKNPLSKDGGKVLQIQKLGLKGTVYTIGDGYTDYQIREKGHAQKFFAYIENVRRENVLKNADYISASFDEILYRLKLPRSQSFPKTMMKVLIEDKISSHAKKIFTAEGYTVARYQQSSIDKLPRTIRDISILCIKPKTVINEAVLINAQKLLAICVFGDKQSSIDQSACMMRGIALFSLPKGGLPNKLGNTSSKAEYLTSKVLSFINTGDTAGCLNLPNIHLPELINAHRFIHIHRNIPGVMASINKIFAKHNINIEGQYLRTNRDIGYVISDVNKTYNPVILKEIKAVPGTIKARVLY